MLTGNLPMGLILCLLTVHGMMCDGNGLSLWSPSCLIMSISATETSASESGRAVSRADLLGIEKRAGTSSTFRPLTVKGESEGVVWTSTALVAGSGFCRAVLEVAGVYDLHIFARCPLLLYVWQMR